MPNLRRNSLEEQIEILNREYEKALAQGSEFSILRNIREQLKELRQQLDGKAQHDGQENDDLE